eukprot:31006-Pelagococcus_subviridis.AAC.4
MKPEDYGEVRPARWRPPRSRTPRRARLERESCLDQQFNPFCFWNRVRRSRDSSLIDSLPPSLPRSIERAGVQVHAGTGAEGAVGDDKGAPARHDVRPAEERADRERARGHDQRAREKLKLHAVQARRAGHRGGEDRAGDPAGVEVFVGHRDG